MNQELAHAIGVCRVPIAWVRRKGNVECLVIVALALDHAVACFFLLPVLDIGEHG